MGEGDRGPGDVFLDPSGQEEGPGKEWTHLADQYMAVQMVWPSRALDSSTRGSCSNKMDC